MADISSIYSKPIYSGSGASGLPFFAGSRRQYGGGIFGSIARYILPAVKSIFFPAAKSLGRSALKVGTKVAADALQGQNVGESFRRHAKAAALDTLSKVAANGPRKRKQTTTPTTTKRAKKRKVVKYLR